MSEVATAVATFTVDAWGETAHDEPAEGPKLTRVVVRKTYDRALPDLRRGRRWSSSRDTCWSRPSSGTSTWPVASPSSEQARAARGCLDFTLSADLLDAGRINILERWESQADVEAFRGEGTSGDQAAQILGASVAEYDVADVRSLTG